ncbi:MAG: Ion transport protein-domain-containing protein [Benjaminiella poitrasii]|nr:MAG: Ion transport protein-domain-containing protein [Benjaminiella poitrasii]
MHVSADFFFYSIETICKVIAYGLILPPQTTLPRKQHSRFYFLSKSLFKKRKNSVTTLRGDNFNLSQDEKVSNNDNDSNDDDDEEELVIKQKHRAYLNSFGNCFDTVSIVSYWADFIMMVYKYPYLSLFKSLGAIRPIRLLSILPGTAVILKSLETSWDLLLAVTGLILFFLIIFALFGLISYQGVFSRRCYYLDAENKLQLVQPALYCAGYMNGTTIIGAYNTETGSTSYPGYQGYICATGQMCIETPSNNPDYGFVNYDTIFNSFLNVYTFVSLELWTDLMYQTQDGDSTVAALYYCLGVYIIAFVLTFLLFAVITSAFGRVRAESAVSAFTAKKKGYPILRDAEGLDDENMWLFDNPPDDLGKGVTRMKLRWWIVRLVRSRSFFYFGGFLVFFDLIFMCLRSFYASEKTLELIDNAETAFTFIFAFEIVLRMIGATSWMSFWSAKTNLFDLFLVITTCVIQLPMIQDSWTYKYLTIFQILRLYRLFICIPRVRRLLVAALGTGESVIYVMVFLILATALCSTAFMQMFGGDYGNIVTNTDPANKFDTFWESFVALIVVYTSETWTAVLYNAMESQAGQGSIYAGIAVSLYFAFGRYIMSGLYIAVVLENFELNDDYIRHYQIKDFIHRHRFKDKHRTETILWKIFKPFYHLNDKKNIQASKLPANLTAPLSKSDLVELMTDLPKTRKPEELKQPSWLERKVSVFFSDIRQKIPFLRKKTSIKAAPINPFIQDTDDVPEDYDIIVAEENRQAIKEITPVVNSLLIFSNRSRVRYYCKKLVGSSNDGQAEKQNLFNWIVMACVFVSIIMVILDEPSTRLMRRDTTQQDIYNTIEIALSIVFIVEVSIRIIADGLLLTPHAYLRNHWNQLDLCVILLNIITIFMGSEEAPRGLSTFRSLRILRLIRYFNGVRDIFVSLFYAFPLMFDALIFTFLVLIPFAVYGVNLFGGLMWKCNDESVFTRGECVGEFEVNISSDDNMDVNLWVPRVWQNPENGFITFDNFPLALQHLFSLTSTEGWVDSMFSAMSSPKVPDIQPEFNWNSSTVYNGIFYIIFMIISQGTIQLFVGVIIEKFKERNGITTLTTAQRQYFDLQRMLASVKPTIKVFRPESKIRRVCYDMVIEKHGRLNQMMMFFVSERYCLVLAAFRLGEGIDALQTLYHAIAKSLPSIIQVSAVFMVAMCLFAMLFMEFFGLTKYGVYGTSHSNFRDYGNALLLLVRATTGEAWNAIILDYAVQYPNCNTSSNYLHNDCGSPFWAYFLFDIFYVVCTHIFLNLFTAVIISNFEYAYETRTRFTKITKADLRMFKQAWADIDPKGTGYIQKEDVAKLLRKLSGQFKFRIYEDNHSIVNIIKASKMSTDKHHPDSNHASPKSPEINSGYVSVLPSGQEINLKEINKCLNKMDKDEIRKRRMEYNLYYKEILRSETSKGIPFASVLTIMSYRFIDISTSLTLDPLIARLEKLDQLTQEYHLEKAAGFFLSQIQKRRFVHQLWKKRDEDEVKKLGVSTTSPFVLGSFEKDNHMYSQQVSESPINYFNMPVDKKKCLPPVPRIVIDNVSANVDQSSPGTAGTTSIPVSPLSNISMENQYDASLSGGPYSLMVAPGTNSNPSSPYTDFDNASRSPFSGGLSPYSPLSHFSSSSRLNWALIDGNIEMPVEVSQGLIDSMGHSIWSGILREEQEEEEDIS